MMVLVMKDGSKDVAEFLLSHLFILGGADFGITGLITLIRDIFLCVMSFLGYELGTEYPPVSVHQVFEVLLESGSIVVFAHEEGRHCLVCRSVRRESEGVTQHNMLRNEEDGKGQAYLHIALVCFAGLVRDEVSNERIC